MYHQWTWDFKLSDTCKNASQKNTKKELKEVPVRVFIYSELHLHSTQSTFRVWYSFPMAQKKNGTIGPYQILRFDIWSFPSPRWIASAVAEESPSTLC